MKKKNKKLYGNGVGTGFETWFDKPRLYSFNEKDGSYRPVGDKSSTVWHGGYWIETMGLQQSADCVTMLSYDKEEVTIFTKEAKIYCSMYHRIDVDHALDLIDEWVSKEYKQLKKNRIAEQAKKKLSKKELEALGV